MIEPRELFELFTAAMIHDGIDVVYPEWATAPEHIHGFYEHHLGRHIKAHGEERIRELIDERWARIGGRQAA